MNMNSVYFNKNGLTSTNANYYANMALELIQADLEKLNSVKFYDTYITIVDGGSRSLMDKGNQSFKEEEVRATLDKISKMYAFNAWVREAIKEKDEALRMAEGMAYHIYKRDNGIEYSLPDSPDKEKDTTEMDIINSWDIAKRNKYLTMEAFASTYGKFIHPNGALSKARKNLHTVVSNPINKEGSGKDTILYDRQPTINPESVDSVFMALQATYREYEKELNQMKADIKDSIADRNLEKESKYQQAYSEYEKKVQEYYALDSKHKSEFNKYKTNLRTEISALKIAIPRELEEVFQTIKELSNTSK